MKNKRIHAAVALAAASALALTACGSDSPDSNASSTSGGASSNVFTIAYNGDGGHQAWVDAVTNSIKNTLGIKAEGKPYATFAELRQDVQDRKMTGGFRTGSDFGRGGSARTRCRNARRATDRRRRTSAPRR